MPSISLAVVVCVFAKELFNNYMQRFVTDVLIYAREIVCYDCKKNGFQIQITNIVYVYLYPLFGRFI